jgi:hypothetical protein
VAGGKMGDMRNRIIVVGIWLLVFGYFAWWGGTRPVWEGDSVAYHLPIAQMVSQGRWLDQEAFWKPWYYYPAMGEVLLAGWMATGLPANWFNLLGWVILSGVVYGLGRRLRLGKEAAVIAAVTVAMWPSVIRLIPTQTVDIWVAVWWVSAALKLMKKDFVWAGVFLGMLVGTKYSGLIFALILILFFYNNLKNHFWYWFIPMILIGGFWYLRNWILVGNPVYPMDISWLGWKGEPNLVLFTGKPIATLFSAPWSVIEALISEYLMWAGLLLLPLVVRNKWTILGLLNFGVYLLLPSRPENIVSDLRYIYPAMIPLLLAAWRKWGTPLRLKASEGQGGQRGEWLKLVSVLGMAAGMTQLDYHPKLFAIVILGAVIGIWKFEILNSKFQTNLKSQC